MAMSELLKRYQQSRKEATDTSKVDYPRLKLTQYTLHIPI